jgi:lipopolysaccharide export system permease protein
VAQRMTVLDRYIAGQILRYFGATLALVTAIYVIADFFDKVDDLIESGLPFLKAAFYFLSRIPVEQLIPASTLLAVMLVFGLMNKHNEIIALKAGGVSIYRLLKVPFTIGLILSLVLLIFSEILLPIVRSNANRMWTEEVKKFWVDYQQRNIWLKGRHAIYHITYFDPVRERMTGVSLNFFDTNFRIKRRIDARDGKYVDGQWVFEDVMEQVRQAKDGSFSVKHLDQLTLPLEFEPADLKRVVKESDEMSLLELSDYIRTTESEGYDATPYRVDWHAKIAFPLVCIILSVIGVTIAGRGRRGENLAIVVVTGIGLAFCFWVLHGFSLSLGYAGMLPPVVAAWLPNMIFFFAAAALLLRAE